MAECRAWTTSISLGRVGRIVYVVSGEMLGEWLAELGVPAGAVRHIPINELVPGVPVEGPVPALAGRVHELHRRVWS